MLLLCAPLYPVTDFEHSLALEARMELAVESDEELMLRYTQGDVRAFELLYSRHRAPFWRFLTRLIGSSAEGEELFQEAWQRVISARSQYQPNAPFRAWLYRVGHNLAIDQLRRKKLAPEQALDDMVLQFASADPSPDARAISAEQHTRLLQSLSDLPAEQRAVVLLKAEGDLSLEQMGELTGDGRETVKSRLRYALNKLKQALS